MGPRACAIRLALIAAAACAVAIASALLGPTQLSWSDILPWFNSAADAPAHLNLFWDARMPRTALAACAGAGLAVGGVIFQALFRNPLATPFTLGVASGASLGAAIGTWLGLWAVSASAFGGALLAMSLVYAMSRLRAGRDMTRLLLAGVCVAYMCSAGVMLAMALLGQVVTDRVVIWMMGSLSLWRDAATTAALQILVTLVVVLGFVAWSYRAIDLLAMSDDVAATRGVHVGRVTWAAFALVGVLTAVIVANCGPIGFVGLMIPHIARVFIGPRVLTLAIGSALLGGAYLAVCDGIVRSFSIYEPPVGVVTNILGAAFFFYLLATRDVAFTDGR